jgi:hypothetical protein
VAAQTLTLQLPQWHARGAARRAQDTRQRVSPARGVTRHLAQRRRRAIAGARRRTGSPKGTSCVTRARESRVSALTARRQARRRCGATRARACPKSREPPGPGPIAAVSLRSMVANTRAQRLLAWAGAARFFVDLVTQHAPSRDAGRRAALPARRLLLLRRAAAQLATCRRPPPPAMAPLPVAMRSSAACTQRLIAYAFGVAGVSAACTASLASHAPTPGVSLWELPSVGEE